MTRVVCLVVLFAAAFVLVEFISCLLYFQSFTVVLDEGNTWSGLDECC
jgi:hypothetical protein